MHENFDKEIADRIMAFIEELQKDYKVLVDFHPDSVVVGIKKDEDATMYVGFAVTLDAVDRLKKTRLTRDDLLDQQFKEVRRLAKNL